MIYLFETEFLGQPSTVKLFLLAYGSSYTTHNIYAIIDIPANTLPMPTHAISIAGRIVCIGIGKNNSRNMIILNEYNKNNELFDQQLIT